MASLSPLVNGDDNIYSSGSCEGQSDGLYKTLEFAVKRMSQLPYLHHYLKILCSSFWREENLLPRLAFSLKRGMGGGEKLLLQTEPRAPLHACRVPSSTCLWMETRPAPPVCGSRRIPTFDLRWHRLRRVAHRRPWLTRGLASVRPCTVLSADPRKIPEEVVG